MHGLKFVGSPFPFKKLITPVAGSHPDDFGVFRFNQWHNGNDLVAPEGTDIVAPEKIVVTGFNTIYRGNTYPDELSNGNYIKAISLDQKREYIFLHLRDLPSVKIGQTIESGQVIAKVGNTGYSTKPHLHLSVVDKMGVYKKAGLRTVGNYVSFFDLQEKEY